MKFKYKRKYIKEQLIEVEADSKEEAFKKIKYKDKNNILLEEREKIEYYENQKETIQKKGLIETEECDSTLILCEKKYNEEVKRSDNINAKANFLMVINTVLISGVFALMNEAEKENKDILLINIFILFGSLIYILLTQKFNSKNYLSRIDDYMNELNKIKEEQKEINSPKLCLINTMNQTIKSYDEVNSKKTKLLGDNIIILVVSIIILAISLLIIYGG